MNQKLAKRWFIKCIVFLVSVLVLITMLVVIVDPYFHFHKPFSFISYRLYDERYINDGISRHFDYDAIITGTSMAQNYKVSELNELFGVNAVKETFSGAGFQEITDNLDRALKRNPNIKKVFYSLDYNGLIREYDWCKYLDEYPTYLYDDNVVNDVRYIFNKTVLYHGVLTDVMMTIKGQPSTTMDEYSSWDKELGLEYILNQYNREDIYGYLKPTLEEREEKIVRQNIQTNLIELANRYPNVEFYMFYSPYSIIYWDDLMMDNAIERQLMAEEVADEMLLKCKNIKLYNFNDQYDIITNLDNYRDKEHYGAHINSSILKWISEDTGLLNEDNYMERVMEERSFFMNYDYDSIFE